MFQVSGVGPMFGQEAHFTHYAKDRHEYAIERYSREVDRLMMVIDKRLGEAEWLAGEEYSIADMATLPYLRRQLIEKAGRRSEEHTSELQSLMRISYAVFCLKKKKKR